MDDGDASQTDATPGSETLHLFHRGPNYRKVKIKEMAIYISLLLLIVALIGVGYSNYKLYKQVSYLNGKLDAQEQQLNDLQKRIKGISNDMGSIESEVSELLWQ